MSTSPLPLVTSTIGPVSDHGRAAAYAVVVVDRGGRCLFSPNLPGLVDAFPWELCWEETARERLREAFVQACMFRRRQSDLSASLRIEQRHYEFRVWLDPAGGDLVIARFVRQFGERLSRREQEVLTLVAGGATNGEIARLLGAQEATIRSHLKKMRDKLGVARSEGLLLAAAGMGIGHDTSG